LNHFLFYQVRPSPGFSSFSPRIVNLLDSFEGKDFQVKRPLALGNPANVNGAAPAASSQPEHLEAYLIREKAGEPRYEKRTRIQVDNELGSIRVDTIIPDRLLVPTATSVHGAASPLNPESIDHFKCYTVRVTPSTAKFSEGIRRSIVDQFNQEKWYDLRKPAHLCTPVNKNGEHPGAEDHLVHLMCYQVKPAKDQPKHQKVLGLSVANQFGEERLDTIVEEELCIPSSVTFPETNVTTP
jgi:hypothetical protein